MSSENIIQLFWQFGLAGVLGFLIGLEREMRSEQNVTLGIRDFVLFALLGALSAYLADFFGSPWLIVASLAGLLTLILSSFWAARDHGSGITTETAAVITFFLGALIMQGSSEIAIALSIVTLAVLLPKQQIKRFRASVQRHEMRAVILFLTITFIVLPVLPNQSLDSYLGFTVATLTEVDTDQRQLRMKLLPDREVEAGELLDLMTSEHEIIGQAEVSRVEGGEVFAVLRGKPGEDLRTGMLVRQRLDIEFLQIMLSSLKPYRIWLIVVLVSFISFVGYVLINSIGSQAGIGLTGLIGGLVSSTVTTLSFARRSKESPDASGLFAMAVLLASSVMFPRLVLEIAFVNQDLMRNIMVPLGIMGLTGLLLAFYLYRKSRDLATAGVVVRFDNPFSLKSAISFALVFATILMATRLATFYLGGEWLPLVAIVSGLTDADAIAFSLSSLEHAGLVSLDWASFNLVLGALSNTFMKLLLIFSLGHRALFKHLMLSFLCIGAVGLVTMFLYYDLAP
ncbi:MAG: MgtC/SapB family protein [Gammaproteobacteria bacterium]|nr:MgtC/SapB family protein [Gammaproteobacteria bacterium]